MFPVLIDLGTWDLPFLGETPIFLPTYGMLFASAVLVSWWWFSRRARTLDVPEESVFNLCFYTLLSGIVGAKLLLILIDWRDYLRHPMAILGTLRSAGVLAGSVIVGSIVFILYARRQKLPVWKLADAMAAPLALAQAIGRLGCYSAGCCWGVPVAADHPLAIVFTNPLAAAQTGVSLNVPLFAVQLVQMAADLVLAAVLTLLWHRKPQPPGTVFWIYLLIYSISRGIIEFWRGDAARGLLGGVSTSQILGLVAVALALAMLVRGRRARAAADA